MELREVNLADMLDARESRANRQRELLARFQSTQVSFTMNIAGPVKNSDPAGISGGAGPAALAAGLRGFFRPALRGSPGIHRQRGVFCGGRSRAGGEGADLPN